MANNFDGIKTQKYGLEVELTGITRAKAAKTVAKYLSTEAEYFGGSYDMYKIKDSQNRTWKIMSDQVFAAKKAMELLQAKLTAWSWFHQFASMMILKQFKSLSVI